MEETIYSINIYRVLTLSQALPVSGYWGHTDGLALRGGHRRGAPGAQTVNYQCCDWNEGANRRRGLGRCSHGRLHVPKSPREDVSKLPLEGQVGRFCKKMASRGGQEGVLGREDGTDKGVREEGARCFGGMPTIQGSCAQGGRRGP